jgi:hypothetical protein
MRIMSTEPTPHSYPELADELSAWLAGGGIVTMALFPLALPIIALTAVAAIPLLLVPLAAALVAGLIVVPLRLARRASRARRRRADGPVTDRTVIASSWRSGIPVSGPR